MQNLKNIVLRWRGSLIRCLNELGLAGVPEWCARDGVLPTAEQTQRQ